MDSLSELVREGCVLFSEMRKERKYYDNDEYVLAICDNLYNSMHTQIHYYLALLPDKEGEREIRDDLAYVEKFVLPTLRDKIKAVSLKIGKVKKQRTTEKQQQILETLKKSYIAYGKYFEDFFALSAFRNIENFALYMEWGLPENDKVWKYNLNCFKGFWYYANRMVLDGTVKILEKQCPVGYGKCIKSDTPILTTNGYKPISDVKIGDLVYSMQDNKPVIRKVLNRWDTKKSQIKITLNSGKTLICSPEHRLYTDKGYKMCKDISVSDYLYEICTPLNYVVSNCKELKRYKNKSWANTNSFKRKWINDFAEKTGLLQDVANDNFIWQKIESVEIDDTLVDMVDIEVEETHNFIANGLVSHNSFADTVMIAYILGIDINSDILKIVGNPTLVSDLSSKLVKYMCKPNYAKVFPYYAQFNGDKNQMFDVCREGGNNQVAKLLIHGSVKGTSFMLANKDTAVDGGRFKYRFYDDVTRSKDKGNINMHELDIKKYNDQWSRRKYDDNNNFEVFSGTTYHIYDFLSTIKRRFGGDEAVQSKVNKYTKYNAKFRSVFVSVPKLDWDTDESTYPHKYTTENARRDRLNDEATFMAMDMQEPLPVEGCAFSYDNLQTYSFIPHNEEDRENECCWAMLDPARTGANYVAMSICLPIDGKHYLKDCIFEMKPMEKMYSVIISKIEQHHITRLHVERNTDTSLAELLRERLAERGINYCTITEIYTYKKKENKIYDNEAAIKANMVFPDFDLYAQGSEMGKFMKYFTSYSYTEKNLYDDSIDSIAMYAEKFITFKSQKNTISFFRRK